MGEAGNAYSKRQSSSMASSSSRNGDLSDILGKSNDDGRSDLMCGSTLDDSIEPSTSSSFRGDPNGMEPLQGESDAEYTARQKRLTDAARERMRSKFGSGGSSMGGVGSDPNYKSLPSQASPVRKATSPMPKVASGDDFFASFGAD